MKSYQIQSGFGRIGIAFAAPFGLLGCIFGAVALFQLVHPSGRDAAYFGAYALLFVVLAAVVYACAWGLGRMVSGALRDEP